MSKLKIVIKVTMPNAKCRSRAMVVVAKTIGVISVAIAGDLKDRLEVVGEGIDITCLVKRLRKKHCHAEVLKVEEVKDKKPEEKKPPEPCCRPCLVASPCPAYLQTPLHVVSVSCEESPASGCNIL